MNKKKKEKLLSKCPYFFRLEAIFGNRPNIHPPAILDSGLNPNDALAAVEKIITEIDGGGEINEGEKEENRKDIEGEWRKERIEEDERNGERREEENSDNLGREQTWDNGGGEEGGEELLYISQRSVREGGEEQKAKEGRQQSLSKGSAIRSGDKRPFPQLIDEEKEEESTSGLIGKGSKRKKGEGGTLIDAVSILASAKTDGEVKRFDFLNRHLLQQGDLRREELALERDRLEIEKEKARAEERRTDLMILQLQASMQVNRQTQEGNRGV